MGNNIKHSNQGENTSKEPFLSVCVYSKREESTQILENVKREKKANQIFEKVMLQMHLSLLQNLQKTGCAILDYKEKKILTKATKTLYQKNGLTAKLTKVFGESAILRCFSVSENDHCSMDYSETFHEISDILITKMCSILNITKSAFCDVYIDLLNKCDSSELLDKFCQYIVKEDSPMTKKVKLCITEHGENSPEKELQNAKQEIIKNYNREKHSSNPYLVAFHEISQSSAETSISYPGYCEKTAHKFIDTMFETTLDEAKNNSHLFIKVLRYFSDPLLGFVVSIIALSMLLFAGYMRHLENTNDLPEPKKIAIGTTAVQLIVLFFQMLGYLCSFTDARRSLFLSLNTMIKNLIHRKENYDVCTELLAKHHAGTRKWHIINMTIAGLFGIVFRCIGVNVPFNLTNIPNDPAALLGISNLTTSALLPSCGTAEILIFCNMSRDNNEIIEYSRYVLSEILEQVKDANKLGAKEINAIHRKIEQKFKASKSHERKVHRKFSCHALLIAFSGAIFSASYMIYNASYGIGNQNTGSHRNSTDITYINSTSHSNVEMSYAEKLYHNQSSTAIIVTSAVIFACKSISTAVIYRDLCKNVVDLKIFGCNFARYFCSLVSSGINSMLGAKPGVPDFAGAIDSAGTVGCAIMQNRVKDELKFECISIESIMKTNQSDMNNSIVSREVRSTDML